jgi:hypothetical protein
MSDPDLSLLTLEDLRRLRKEAEEILAQILAALAPLPEFEWPAAKMLHIRQLRLNLERYGREIEARSTANSSTVTAAYAPQISAPARLFFSYSHKDEDLRNELAVQLALLRRQGILSDWHDRQILPGHDWKEVLDANLESADIILLLIIADFLASDYCYEKEMRRAMQRNGVGAIVIPVILRYCDWSSAPFAKLQELPKNGRPIMALRDRDEAWTDVVRGIRAVLNDRIPQG